MNIKIFSKKAVAILLSLAVLTSTLMLQTFSAFALEDNRGQLAMEPPSTIWNGSVADGFEPGGDGTKDNPYVIKTAEQLALLGKYIQEGNTDYNSKCYKLNNTILLNDVSADNWYEQAGLNEWTYGASGKTFDGVFDGNGYAVKGIYVKTDQKYVGFFSRLSRHTTVKNLGIEKSYIETTFSADGAAGAIAGGINNWADGDHIIDSCYVADTVTVKSASIAGGLIGNCELNTNGTALKMSNCYSSAVIEGASGRAASLIGFWYFVKYLDVTSCYATHTDLKMVNTGSDSLDKRTRLFEETYFTNCYTLGINDYRISDLYPNYAVEGITVLTEDKIIGKDAAVNLKGFKFPRIWYARNDEQPVPTVFMHLAPDTVNPVFTEGALAAKPFSATSAAVTWPIADDDVSSPADMTYNLYVSTAPIASVTEDMVPYGSYIGKDDAVVENLVEGQKYYFALTATDNANLSTVDILTLDYTHTGWNPTDVWDGTVAKSLELGEGTLSNPYKITTAEELAYLAQLSASENASETKKKYYTLTTDIDLAGKEWTFGTSDDISENAFFGTFDGDGHTVKGLKIDTSAKTYNGLFAGINSNAVVQNLGIKESSVKAGEEGYAGALAGGRSSAIFKDGVMVQSSYIDSSVSLEGEYAGGFFGTAEEKTTFINCYSKAEPKGTTAAGTFVGDHAVDGKTIVVNGSYSTSANLPLVAKTGKKSTVTYQNCYTTGADGKGLASITLEHMTGLEVKSYMSTFDFSNTWLAEAEDTPSLALFTPIVVWDGSVATDFDGGTGTENDPYRIANASQLALFGSKFATYDTTYNAPNVYYELTADILLNDVSKSNWYENAGVNVWTYGESGTFCANLDGNGHVIKGIYVKSEQRYVGLFSNLNYHTSITNLGLESSYIETTNSGGAAGAIAGGIGLWANGDHIIENCYVADTVTVKSAKMAGGFIGNDELNSTYEVTVNGQATTAYRTIYISNCYSSANLEGTTKGSLIGQWYNINGLKATNCYGTQSGVRLIGNVDTWDGNLNKLARFLNDEYCVNCYTSGVNTEFTFQYKTGEKDADGSPIRMNEKHQLSGVTVLTADQISGVAAKDYMVGFDFADKDNQNATWYTRYGKAPHLMLFNNTPLDFVGPSFNEGGISALEKTGISITVTWPEAVDNYTPSAFMEYTVYSSDRIITASDIENASASVNLIGTCGSEREITLKGLTLGEAKYFAVCAVDQTGNKTYIFGDKAIKTERTKTSGVWSGSAARSFDFGVGSATDPYIIANAEQLAYLMEHLGDETKDKYYALSNDIELNDVSSADWKDGEPTEWVYGTDEYDYRTFFGTLNGNGHVVKGLYINSTATRAGLFVEVGGSAAIEELGIVDSFVSINNDISNCYAGALVGQRNSNSSGEDGVFKIKRCFIAQSVTVYAQTYNSEKARTFAGGFIGAIQQGQGSTCLAKTLLEDCYSGADVYATEFARLFLGDCYADNNSINFYRCFTTLFNARWVNDWYDKNAKNEDGTLMDTVVYHDCYAPDGKEDGVETVNIVKMLGKDAVTSMPALDFNKVWTTASEAPILQAFRDHPEYGLQRVPVTVSFDTDGAGRIEPIVGLVGEKLELPTITREGYLFKNWNLFYKFPYPIDTFPAYDITLKAEWEDLAALRVTFESYPYKTAGVDGLGEDYELYRPGVAGYQKTYVHSGGYSMHRIGELENYSEFQLFSVDDTPLKAGKNYQLKMWVYADEVTSGTVQLVSADRIKLTKHSTLVADAVDVTKLEKGEWQEITVNFTAQGKYLLIRTPGLNSLYFDDISVFDYSGDVPVYVLPEDDNTTNSGNNGTANDKNEAPSDKNEAPSDKNEASNDNNETSNDNNEISNDNNETSNDNNEASSDNTDYNENEDTNEDSADEDLDDSEIKTGESNAVVVFCIIFVASALLLTLAIILKKKKS